MRETEDQGTERRAKLRIDTGFRLLRQASGVKREDFRTTVYLMRKRVAGAFDLAAGETI